MGFLDLPFLLLVVAMTTVFEFFPSLILVFFPLFPIPFPLSCPPPLLLFASLLLIFFPSFSYLPLFLFPPIYFLLSDLPPFFPLPSPSPFTLSSYSFVWMSFPFTFPSILDREKQNMAGNKPRKSCGKRENNNINNLKTSLCT